MRWTSLLLCVAGLLAGCGEAHESTKGAEGSMGVFRRWDEASVASHEYIVDPPDQIQILAPGINELNNQSRTVDQTGHVTFNLIGSIYVAGMTPEKISETLRDATKKYYTNPDIKIVVTAQSKFYYVFGPGVNSQGKHAFTGRDSLISALADAGFNDGAWPEQVHVSRPEKKGGKATETAVVDFTKVWETGDLKQNYLIEEGDIIWVRDDRLTAYNKNMTKILGPITGTSSAVNTATSVKPGKP